MKQEKNTKTPKYIFIDKTIFFPKEGILVIGDLHIGYEYMLRQSGVLIPERQIKDMISELKHIFSKIKIEGFKLNKIILLGDIKHAFAYEPEEKNEFLNIMDFLKQNFSEENIILIKGNHDTMDFTYGNMVDYHIDGNIAFLHGHMSFPEIFDKKIKILVSGHLHPSVILEENPGVKREDYKCFLVGSMKGKTFIILPSFLGFAEGTPVNDYKENYIESFSIIPEKDILRARVHVIGKDKVYDFGRVGDL